MLAKGGFANMDSYNIYRYLGEYDNIRSEYDEDDEILEQLEAYYKGEENIL